jgi:hypothetical protein
MIEAKEAMPKSEHRKPKEFRTPKAETGMFGALG